MGAIQVVISRGKEINNITLAAMAGLKTFCPKPPNTCLLITTANRLPNTAIHHGAKGGNDKANSQAVKIPERSINTGRTSRPCQLTTNASPTIAAINDTTHKLIAGQPYNQKPNSVAGASAYITVTITLPMEIGACACGECAIGFMLSP